MTHVAGNFALILFTAVFIMEKSGTPRNSRKVSAFAVAKALEVSQCSR